MQMQQMAVQKQLQPAQQQSHGHHIVREQANQNHFQANRPSTAPAHAQKPKEIKLIKQRKDNKENVSYQPKQCGPTTHSSQMRGKAKVAQPKSKQPKAITRKESNASHPTSNSVLPEQVSSTLEQIVNQLSIVTQTLGVLEERLPMHEDRVQRVEGFMQTMVEQQRQQLQQSQKGAGSL